MEIKFKLVKNDEIDAKIGEVWVKLNPLEKSVLKQRICELIIMEENFIRGIDALLEELEKRNKADEEKEIEANGKTEVETQEEIEEVEEVDIDNAKTIEKPKKFVVKPRQDITM